MRTFCFRTALALAIVAGAARVATADDYAIDAAHSGVSFQISHLGLSYVHGRFDEFQRQFHDRQQRSRQVNVRA